MAVPKKRTGKSAQAKRRANWKATVPAVTTCSKCGAAVPAHTVCPECGSYKGKVVSIKNENYKPADEAAKEEKPKAKRTRKPKVEETPVENQVEETKEEVKSEEE